MRKTSVLAFALLWSCQFDKADRWVPQELGPVEPICVSRATRCNGALERCNKERSGWELVEDCPAKGLACSTRLGRCAPCDPGAVRCNGQTIETCNPDGQGETAGATCDITQGQACREGTCRGLCVYARQARSNVGCEYWGADLDNLVDSDTDPNNSAAAQQFALVVSNPQPDLEAHVIIEQDDSLPGEPPKLRTMAESSILPLNLETFKLGPREVDGSPDGQFNTGTGTALTRHAYRITSSVPIVAYQFNPLEDVNVKSNDASLLKPTEALTYEPGVMGPAYVVVGWPQTLAVTDDPNTNFSAQNPVNSRAFLTLIGTRPNSHVRIKTATHVIPGGPVAETAAGGTIEATLEPFEVLNLETGGANADFTSSTIDSDQPVVVFSGSEASDAPFVDQIALRQCCADHLEEQLDPIRTAGKAFVLPHSPSRTQAIKNAGGDIGVFPEPEYFRIVAVSDGVTNVQTSLPSPNDHFQLSKKGEVRDLVTFADVAVTADRPVIVGDVQASQEAAFVPIDRGLPGGDPSFVIIPPVEQYRADYVFLTPDKYAFDFIVVVAKPEASVLLDGQPLDPSRCDMGAVPGYVTYRCQLSFPRIDSSPAASVLILPGLQNDGVHRVVSNAPIGVLVFGWSYRVSYGYAAGTELEDINDVR